MSQVKLIAPLLIINQADGNLSAIASYLYSLGYTTIRNVLTNGNGSPKIHEVSDHSSSYSQLLVDKQVQTMQNLHA